MFFQSTIINAGYYFIFINGIFYFNFTFDNNVKNEYIKKEIVEPKNSTIFLNSNNLCPYPIPTIEEIIKDIDKCSACKTKCSLL